MKTKENGVTLIALVITIILILILASLGTTIGTETINSTAFTQFKAELKIMQDKVNELNQENINKTNIPRFFFPNYCKTSYIQTYNLLYQNYQLSTNHLHI